MRATEVTQEHEETRAVEYLKPAQVEGLCIRIIGITEQGESNFENEKGEHDAYLMLLIQYPDGSEWKDGQLRVGGRYLVPMIAGFFERHPGETIDCVLRKDYPYAGAKTQAWTMQDWPSQATAGAPAPTAATTPAAAAQPATPPPAPAAAQPAEMPF